jgi:3-hydroxyisobutyrate dehydrogenase/glyoxylate/succinic semialdehyde reductase
MPAQLNCMGSKIVHAGEQGKGVSLKMVMNQLLGTAMAGFAEGMALGESMGLPRDVLFEAVLNGPMAAPFMSAKRKRIESGDFEDADFPLQWLQKDLHLASVCAYETGVAMPLTNVAKEIYRMAIQEGDGDKDFSAIYRLLARNRDTNASGE